MDSASQVTDIFAEFSHPGASAATILCDRHPAEAVALTVVGHRMSVTDLTFGELHESSRRVAAALYELGVEPGDRVATLMGKSLDLVGVMLGIWRLGAVYVPLFTAFAPQAISMRLESSGSKVVIVDATQRPKLDPGPDMAPDAEWQIVVVGDAASKLGEPDLATLMRDAAPYKGGDAAVTGGDGAFVHTFTSGTTGKPKGVVHPLSYVAGWQIYLEHALGVTDDDVFWCAADPGWAYGLYAAIIAPLATGRRSVLHAGTFDAAVTWQVLAELGVTNFAAAPTVFRSLRTTGRPPSILRLKRASSAGEPLTPEVNEWAVPTLGVEVHDHFGQTEVGMVLANHHHPALARPIKRGSMGRAISGWELTVLEPDDDRPAAVGALGRLAIDVARSPLMTFEGYDTEDRQADKFSGDGRWYLLGDAAYVDGDGDFFFSARDDDVIIMAGYRIGPFDVESVIAQHDAVAECAVIGAPDQARGEVLEAYVVLRPDSAASDGLVGELQRLVKERYAAHAYPRAVHFVDELPKTPSGKIQRAALRRRRRRELATAAER